MASADYWAEAPVRRQQMALFAPTLDEMIAADDPVRLVDEILAKLDWSEWEALYDGQRGQPPIHPRIIAAGMLYGLCRGLRSTRKLEEACCYRVDFMWLVEGRRIDHTTFAKFRTRFDRPLKKLFRELVRIAMTLGLVRLGEVAFDGTRVQQPIQHADRRHAGREVGSARCAVRADAGRVGCDGEAGDARRICFADDAARAARGVGGTPQVDPHGAGERPRGR